MRTRIRVLDNGRLPPALRSRLAAAYDLHRLADEADPAAFLAAHEAALVRALAERRIAGAGLDVFENEPQVPAALTALDNVVLLPHIASATRETRQAMADRVFDNLQSFFTHGRLVSPAPLS